MHIFIHIIIIAIKIALNDADNTSKNGNSDGMIAFRAQSSARSKGKLMPVATFVACKLLISNKKRNRQEIKENEERRRK